MRLRVGARVTRTACEGPGTRYALWMQGCAIRCAGCCNPQFFAARGGELLEVSRLLAEARAAGGEGVTLLGGEPFDQAGPLSVFAVGARAAGLSVMTFTGYWLEELRARNEPAVTALLAATDLLVDGPYDATRPESLRRWAGSTNQRFHFLTSRYAPGIESPAPGEILRQVEVELAPDGRVRANGWPELSGL
jgi:anaerobic ribonucleoside-triphosphate reductase activating protein